MVGRLLIKIFLGFAVFLGLADASDKPPAVSSSNPNIVFILSDDMGWAQPGFHGDKKGLTPNLDRLAAEESAFRNFIFAAYSRRSPKAVRHGIDISRFDDEGRIVELECTPQDTTTCVQCRVQVLRLSIPEAPIEGAGQMGGIHTESSTRYQTLEVDRHKQAQIVWLDAGPDHDLERKILGRIQRDIEKGMAVVLPD